MEKFLKTIVELLKKTYENELINLASELTYKLLLATFPMLIALIAVLGAINIDPQYIAISIGEAIPDDVLSVIMRFFESLQAIPPSESKGVIPYSLIFAIVSASSGFFAVIRGINKTYGTTDERGIIVDWIISVGLVIVFTITIVTILIVFIFGGRIIDFVARHGIVLPQIDLLYVFLFGVIATLIVLFVVMFIYKIASAKKLSFRSTVPGAVFTLFFWGVSSMIFNFYVDNFSKVSLIYGSIGSVLLYILWLNIIAFILLVGSQLNAILLERASNLDSNSLR